MFQLWTFTRNVCTLSIVVDCSVCDISVPNFRHLQHSGLLCECQPAVHLGLQAFLVGDLEQADYSPPAVHSLWYRSWLRKFYQHCLKNTATRAVTCPAVRRFRLSAVWMTVKPASSAITPLFTVWEQEPVFLVAKWAGLNKRCSLAWTGVVQLRCFCNVWSLFHINSN